MTERWTRATVLALALLGAGGCVSQERHDAALHEVQRLRREAYQRTNEAAALRQMLDRVVVEYRLREPANIEIVRRYGELAAVHTELARRCAMPAEAPHAALPADPLPPLAPGETRGRRVGGSLWAGDPTPAPGDAPPRRIGGGL